MSDVSIVGIGESVDNAMASRGKALPGAVSRKPAAAIGLRRRSHAGTRCAKTAVAVLSTVLFASSLLVELALGGSGGRSADGPSPVGLALKASDFAPGVRIGRRTRSSLSNAEVFQQTLDGRIRLGPARFLGLTEVVTVYEDTRTAREDFTATARTWRTSWFRRSTATTIRAEVNRRSDELASRVVFGRVRTSGDLGVVLPLVVVTRLGPVPAEIVVVLVDRAVNTLVTVGVPGDRYGRHTGRDVDRVVEIVRQRMRLAFTLSPLAPPSLSGTMQAGRRAVVAGARWSGAPDTTTYAWWRCDETGRRCARIAHADSDTYRLTRAEIGFRVRADVTARNTVSVAIASSPPSQVVGAEG